MENINHQYAHNAKNININAEEILRSAIKNIKHCCNIPSIICYTLTFFQCHWKNDNEIQNKHHINHHTTHQ